MNVYVGDSPVHGPKVIRGPLRHGEDIHEKSYIYGSV